MQLENLNLQIKQDKEQFEREKQQKISDLGAVLNQNKAESDKNIQKRIEECVARENAIKTLEDTFKKKYAILEDSEQKLSLSLLDLTEEKERFEDEKQAFTEKSRSFEEQSINKEKELTTRENEVKRLESDILRRNESLKQAEKLVADREDYTVINSKKVETQVKRLSELTDTYERKIAGVIEKEKVLEIRSIKLTDREAVAATHRTS